MHSHKQNAIDFIEAGDIGAAVGFNDIKTGDTMTDEKYPIVLESMDFPDPVIGIAVEPKTKADVDKLGISLAKLAEEDPTFTVRTDEASGQPIISGMGELHLDIIVARLRREFKVEVNQGQPQVEYKEAITQLAEHREVYKKQSGGRGKFADIVFTLEPAEEGKEGLEFVSVIKGGNVPKEFIPSVEKGFKDSMKNGPLAGFEVDSMKVTLKDGSFHPVDSDSLSFDLRVAYLDTEITSSYEALDNLNAELYFFGEEPIRYSFREDIRGNELAKSPELTANMGLVYTTPIDSGLLTITAELIHRGAFQQRVFNNLSLIHI